MSDPRYPPEWDAVARQIRESRAAGRCECRGECGLHRRTGGRPRRCVERDRQPARWACGVVMLTTAHLCECVPLCADPAHVRAMCNRCHLRVDVSLHVVRAAGSRDAKRGQSRLVPLAYEEAEARRRANAARLEIDRVLGTLGTEAAG